MTRSDELNVLTARELGKIARDLKIPGWHAMRKEELIHSLIHKSRSKPARDLIQARIQVLQTEKATSAKPKTAVLGQKAASRTQARKSSVTPPEQPVVAPGKKESGRVVSRTVEPSEQKKGQPAGQRHIALHVSKDNHDRLALLVRDPFWIQAFWELSDKTLKRAEVAMRHFWHNAFPILRLYRIDADGSSHPRRQPIRDIRIHGGVNHWYIDVDDPPGKFQVELGYMSRSQKFHSLISSNSVETPQRQVVDEWNQLDGNWSGVADDLGRIFKLSSGEANNSELRKVFEEQLHRPMSGVLLTQYRAARRKGTIDKTRRNFQFNVDVDLIIHGQSDPGVQVSIRNEPIQTGPDGAFFVRFPMPEKRTIFPIEAEGSDGVEMQRIVLTVERNTRLLETLFQEPAEDD